MRKNPDLVVVGASLEPQKRFAVVQLFPVVETVDGELVRPPLEYGTLVKHPQPLAA